MSAYVHFSAQKQVKIKKKVIMFAYVHISTQKQVKAKKKGHHVHISAPKQVKTKKRSSMSAESQMFNFLPINKREDQKKGHHVRRPLFAQKLSIIFRGRMICLVFTVRNAKKEDLWPFFDVLQKERMVILTKIN